MSLVESPSASNVNTSASLGVTPAADKASGRSGAGRRRRGTGAPACRRRDRQAEATAGGPAGVEEREGFGQPTRRVSPPVANGRLGHQSAGMMAIPVAGGEFGVGVGEGLLGLRRVAPSTKLDGAGVAYPAPDQPVHGQTGSLYLGHGGRPIAAVEGMEQGPQPPAGGCDRGVSQQLHTRVELGQCPPTVLPDQPQQRPGHDRGAPTDFAMASRDSDGLVDGRLHLGALIQKSVTHRLQDVPHPGNEMQPQPARLGSAGPTRCERARGIGMVAGPGGHLQADRGGGRQRTGGKRGLAGLGEPVQRTATDQVDGAQLMQDPDTPEAEIVLIGQDAGRR